MERELNGVIIRQETKTQFLNANDLLRLYHKGKDVIKKDIDDFMNRKSTRQFIDVLIKEEISNTQKTGELESPYYGKRGKYGGTWMHPYLFMDFAMWLSPKFKLTCIRWIYDNLIKNRIEAGDGFKEINEALFNQNPRIPHWEYSNEARMINKLVFGKCDKGQRNNASEKQLEMLDKLQKADVKLINKNLDRYDRLDELKKVIQYIQLSN